MMCKWDGCAEPKGAGRGRRYCEVHQAESRTRRRTAASERLKAWRKKNYAHNRLTDRVRVYGLTKDEFLELLEFQDGRCAICRKFGGLKLHVDHDHATGIVRGLLCWSCNQLLKHARDRAFILDAAASYLAHPITVQANELVHGEVSA